ncbi:hypothetical protein OV450_8142 [Actinobacteria bacterium OV450]|nr:hypothetical protein OV450_8142 [Actinobacteria bacterium OV450]
MSGPSRVSKSCPASSSKTSNHAPRSWALLLPVTTAPSVTAPHPVRPARPPDARGPAGTSVAGAGDTTPRAGCIDRRTSDRSAPPPEPGSLAGPRSSRAGFELGLQPFRLGIAELAGKATGFLGSRAALPPSRQAASQAYADFRDTRNLRATSITLAGPAPSGSTGHVPALSGPLSPSPASPGSGCPQLLPSCCDSGLVQVFHLHSNQQRLTAQAE